MAFRRKKRTQEPEEGDAPASPADPAVEPSPGPEGAEEDSARPTTVGDDVAEAATFAGDPAAAGTDAEGPGADAGGPEGSANEVAASPDPAYAPAAEPIREWDSPGDDSSATATASAGTVADRAEALVEQRPELLVAGAFAGGLVLARVIAALGGRR